MKTSDLDRNDVRAIDAVASLLYETSKGSSAIYELAHALRWEEYGPCEPCEDKNVPILDGCCMLCGSPREEG